jgi:sugar phosphate permease
MPVGGLLTPLVVVAMTHVGWRWMAFLSGVLVLLVGLPAAQVVRHRPELYGEHPDGERPEPTGGERAHPIRGAAAPAAAVDFTPREAVRAPAFWYIALGHGSALLVVSAVTVHLVAYVTESLGYSLHQAALVVALMTVVQVAAQVAGGFAGDRVSKRAIVVCCMVAHAAGLLLLTFATAFWMVAMFAVLHGTAWGVRGPLMSAIRADYFGAAAFGTITGFSSMIVMFGMMGGPLIAGILADQTGSYEIGFRVLAGLAALGSIFFVLARRPDPPARS